MRAVRPFSETPLNMPKALSLVERYGELSWKVLLLLGVVANLWLTSNFVSQAEMQAYKLDNAQAHSTLSASVTEIVTSIKVMNANAVNISDHEMRLRGVESRQTDVLARLSTAERDIREVTARTSAIESRQSDLRQYLFPSRSPTNGPP